MTAADINLGVRLQVSCRFQLFKILKPTCYFKQNRRDVFPHIMAWKFDSCHFSWHTNESTTNAFAFPSCMAHMQFKNVYGLFFFKTMSPRIQIELHKSSFSYLDGNCGFLCRHIVSAIASLLIKLTWAGWKLLSTWGTCSTDLKFLTFCSCSLCPRGTSASPQLIIHAEEKTWKERNNIVDIKYQFRATLSLFRPT